MKPWEKYKTPPASGGGSKPWERYSTAPTREPASQEPESSVLEALAEKGLQGATLGFADEIGGALGAGYDKLTGEEGDLSDLYVKNRDTIRNYDKKLGEEHPIASFVAELGGGFLAPGAALARSGAKGAAALGGLYGLGKSEGESVGEVAGDALTGAAVGGALGYGIDKVAKAIPGAAKAGAENLAARAAGPTPRDLLIWKKQPGGVRGVGREILDSGAIKPLQSVDGLADDLAGAVRQSGQELESIRGQQITADPMEVIRKIYKRAIEPSREVGTPLRHETQAGLDELRALVEGELRETAGGKVNLRELPISKLQQLKEGYRKGVNFDAMAAAQGGGKRVLTPAPQQIRAAIATGLEDAQQSAISQAGGALGPRDLARYMAEKRRYGNLSQASGAAARSQAREAAKLPIGPYDLGAGIAMAGHGPKALLAAGATRLARNRGATTAAWTLDKISKFASGPAAGKFGATLRQANSRGKAALAATHHVLFKSSPEYRRALSETEQE